MRFTHQQYDDAIAMLEAAKLQQPQEPCSICHEITHSAWDCGSNPLVAIMACRRVVEQADGLHDTLHDTLHYLSGHYPAFGEALGPAKVVPLEDDLTPEADANKLPAR